MQNNSAEIRCIHSKWMNFSSARKSLHPSSIVWIVLFVSVHAMPIESWGQYNCNDFICFVWLLPLYSGIVMTYVTALSLTDKIIREILFASHHIWSRWMASTQASKMCKWCKWRCEFAIWFSLSLRLWINRFTDYNWITMNQFKVQISSE